MQPIAWRGVALLISGFFLLQLAWMITVPPFRGSDEVDHAYRAAAVAGGEWVAGEYADDGRGWLVKVPADLVQAARAQCERLGLTGPDNCRGAGPSDDGDVMVASSAAGYHPAYYWVVGKAGAAFDGASALYAMRAASAVLCLVFIGLAAWTTCRRDTSWPAAGLVLATSPVLVYSTAVVAPNGLELAAAISLWSSLLALPEARSGRDERVLMWVAIASAGVMGTLRLLGPFFVLLVLAAVLLFHGRDPWGALRRQWHTLVAGCLLVGLAVAGFAWWVFGPHVLEPATGGPEGAGHFALGNLVVWPLQSIAAFPYRDQMGPAVVYAVIGALVLTLVVEAMRDGTSRERWVVALCGVGALALPVVITLATMEGRGVIWQGRYGLPFGVGFVLMAAYVVGRHAPSRRPARLLVLPAALALGVAVGASLLKVRAAELADNPASRLDEAWHVPSPLLLVGLSLVAMACFTGALGWGRRERT